MKASKIASLTGRILHTVFISRTVQHGHKRLLHHRLEEGAQRAGDANGGVVNRTIIAAGAAATAAAAATVTAVQLVPHAGLLRVVHGRLAERLCQRPESQLLTRAQALLEHLPVRRGDGLGQGRLTFDGPSKRVADEGRRVVRALANVIIELASKVARPQGAAQDGGSCESVDGLVEPLVIFGRGLKPARVAQRYVECCAAHIS